MGAAKLTLELDYDFDFYLVGLRSDLADYRLAYLLNKELEIKLQRSAKDLLLDGIKGAPATQYTYFEFLEKEMDRDWFLASNRGDQLLPSADQGLFSGQGTSYRTEYLLSELKTFDYLLVVHGLLGKPQEDRLQKILKEVPGILAMKTVDPEQLKHRDHLLFLDQ